MKLNYTIKINEVKSEDSHVKGFATVTFAESLQVSHIAIIQKKDADELFVSMPSYRTNEMTEKGEPVYRDICNPITKEFYEELTSKILEAYDRRATIGNNVLRVGDFGTDLPFTVKVTPMSREDTSLKGLGRVYINDEFVISNVKLIEGKNGFFISMPDYRTDKIRDGKPVYREICYPVTKDFREKLYASFEQAYHEELAKKSEKEPEKQEKTTKKAKSEEKKAEKEPEPALAR